MSLSDDLELQRLQAEESRLRAYVDPHDAVRAWLTLASVTAVCAACVFLLAGWIQDQVRFANLFAMTILAALIAYGVTWQFRWEGQVVTIGQLIKVLVGRAIAIPDDLDEARTRLQVCRARIAHLKGSRR